MSKFFIITFGCQMNASDSERIAVMLKKQGHKPAKDIKQAGLVVINACSVRQAAMHRVYAQINKLYKTKKIVLSGCVLEADRKKLKDKIIDFWHPNKYFCLSSPRKSALVLSEAERSSPRESAFSPRKSAFVPIMTGCNNFCSYCVVPYTRGREKSRPAEEIIKEIAKLIKNGVKEILLLGQNVNSYLSTDYRLQTTAGKKTKKAVVGSRSAVVRFSRLLRLINTIPGNFTIKFMTSHPKDMSDELINTIAACEKISHEIHLPIQSGDNAILRKMNRKYTAEHYEKLVKKIRAKIPDVIISTDIIVGFPGETKKQFANTIKLFKELKFNKAYINKYSPRFGTAAYKLKDNIPQTEKKRRWKILDDLVNKKITLPAPSPW